MVLRKAALTLLWAGFAATVLAGKPSMDDPLQAETPGALHAEIDALRKAAPKKQMKAFESYVSELRQSLADDPFKPGDAADDYLVKLLHGKVPSELIASEYSDMSESSEYWSLREENYRDVMGELTQQQERAVETAPLLEDVYVYNYHLEFTGTAMVEKAYVVFQCRNGTNDPIDVVRLRAFLLQPGKSMEAIEKATRWVRIPGKLQPWETKTVKHDITNMLPDKIKQGLISNRDDLAVELRLINFKPLDKQWAVTDFPRYKMDELERTQRGLEEARLALGKSPAPAASGGEDSMMMMAE